MSSRLFVGSLVHCNKKRELLVIKQAAVLVENGKITDVIVNPNLSTIKADHVTYLNEHEFLIPGLIDCHTHAVQFPNLGLGYDRNLLDWLEKYTFPLEKKYVDENFAKHVFKTVVKRTLDMGTTTACYFASLYGKACMELAQAVSKYGQRAFIGKVNMNIDRDDGYCENTVDSIKNTVQFVDDINALNNPLIKPIITPRFALSCDMKLMIELGLLAKNKNLRIQTHISENLDEIKAVLNMFKDYTSYASVYNAAGLLTDKTILAHAIYLTDSEIALVRQNDTAVIHCPSSNTCLKSGMCDVRKLISQGLKVGLGTDVAGGQSSSMVEAMRSALAVSNNLATIKNDYISLDYKEVFYMATLGGAISLGIDEEVGNLMPGKQFDALVINMNVNDSPIDNLMSYTLEEQLQRFIYSGDDRNILEVYVSGRKVK
ncbi:PREDICTED: guanine deaminase [Polistes dominula]|uniref:Guanine deaminase n=1 Tax=Polistes dominula TaxID=743375 RepID=A0ABM1IQ14_POLDO|nr:PREDICTED: guanine deaminase [Polistes dominula]XP_015182301.1 PREDICTED: guanine deaminase [Polistes dominula]